MKQHFLYDIKLGLHSVSTIPTTKARSKDDHVIKPSRKWLTEFEHDAVFPNITVEKNQPKPVDMIIYAKIY